MTSRDGYEMARKGRAGAALAIAAIGSFLAGTIGVVGLTLFAIPLAALAVQFGPAEYLLLLMFAMTAVAARYGDSPGTGTMSALLGMKIATIRTYMQTGEPRFKMGVPSFLDGIGLEIVVVGRLDISEVRSGIN